MAWRRLARRLSLGVLLLTVPPAAALESDFNLDLRDFTVGQRNHENSGFADEFVLLHLLSARLKSDTRFSPAWMAQAHLLANVLARSSAVPANFSGFSLTGNGPLYVIEPLDLQIADEEHLQARLLPDRLLLQWQSERLTFSAGRQAVSFGKTFFWNPTDWLGAFGANTLDRDYKPGIDVVRFDMRLTPMSNLSLLYAFGDAAAADESAALLAGSFAGGGFDLELLVGRLREQWRFGGGFSITPDWLGGGALRGEWATHVPEAEPQDYFSRATLGYDYQFPNSLQLVGEYHYNGFGVTDTADYAALFTAPEFVTGEITVLAQHYLAAVARYELSALTKAETALQVNLLDGSLAISPGLSRSLADELDLRLGALLPVGSPPRLGAAGPQLRSEYGNYPTFVWLQLLWTI